MIIKCYNVLNQKYLMNASKNTNQPPDNPSASKVKSYGNRILGEIFTGLILVIVPLAIGYLDMANLNTALVIWLFVIAIIGVCFLNLAYMRGVSKSYFSWASPKGGPLAVIAKGIEWILGIRG